MGLLSLRRDRVEVGFGRGAVLIGASSERETGALSERMGPNVENVPVASVHRGRSNPFDRRSTPGLWHFPEMQRPTSIGESARSAWAFFLLFG
jgi:hypothetical protein